MSAAGFTANLAAYVLQTALLMLVGLLLPRLFGMRDPRVRLRYWHALLTVSLLLPFAWLAWKPQAPAVRSFTGVLAGGMELDVRAGAAPEHLSPWIWVPVALAVVAVVRALWLAAGMITLERLRRSGRALNPLPDPFEEASRTLFVDADFRVSRSVSTPLTFGWFRPVVLLPEAVAGMSPDEQRCVALHELLHVRRRDWLATLAEELLRSLLWFHPALWLVLDRVALSREQVVDREVVSITEARRTYMNTLSAMARTRYPAAAVAILPFFHRSHLLQRLALLTQEVSMSKLRWRLAAAGSAVVLLLAGVVAARAFPLLHGTSTGSGGVSAASHGSRYELAINTESGPADGQHRFVVTVVDGKTGRVVFNPQLITQAGEPATASTEGTAGPDLSIRIDFDKGATQAKYVFVATENGTELQREEGNVFLVDPPEPGVYEFGQKGVTGPDIIEKPELKRPENAPDKNKPVIVVVGLVVTKEGGSKDVRILKSGEDALDRATMDWVSKFRWKPATLEGKPVDLRWTFTVRWGADNGSAEPSLMTNDFAEPSAPEPGVYKMGTKGIDPPKIVTQVPPDYTEEMKSKGIDGRVVLSVVIDDHGVPTRLKVLKSVDETYDRAAMDAVKKWRWEPPTLDGKPVSVEWVVVIRFVPKQ